MDSNPCKDRINLRDGQRIVEGQTTYAVEVPVGFWKLSWESAGISTHVAKILTEEVLGYNSSISGIGGSSASNVYATAGAEGAPRAALPLADSKRRARRFFCW